MKALGAITDLIISADWPCDAPAQRLNPSQYSMLGCLHGAIKRCLSSSGIDLGSGQDGARVRWSISSSDPAAGSPGWLIYFEDGKILELVKDSLFVVQLGRSRGAIAFNAPRSVSCRDASFEGLRVVELHMVTPFIRRRQVKIEDSDKTRSEYRLRPTAEMISSALVELAERQRLIIDQRLEVELISARGITRKTFLTHKVNGVFGWIGTMELAVNAPAFNLLTLAASGINLGGKSAYGMGMCRLRDTGRRFVDTMGGTP